MFVFVRKNYFLSLSRPSSILPVAFLSCKLCLKSFKPCSFRSNFINGKPLKIILEGVACMNDDPSEVVVLYAKVKLDDRTDRYLGMCPFFLTELC